MGTRGVAWCALLACAACTSTTEPVVRSRAPELPYRPFAPLAVDDTALPSPLPSCADAALVLRAEAARTAAVAKVVRAQGAVLVSATWVREQPRPVGAMFRGPQGQRWLVLDDSSGCPVGPAPLVKLDATKHVSWVVPKWVASKTTTLAWCDQPHCDRGCGVPSPLLLVAEVPEDALVGEGVALSVPLEHDVAFAAEAESCPQPH